MTTNVLGRSPLGIWLREIIKCVYVLYMFFCYHYIMSIAS
jgi:hypothetical protein